MQFHLRTLFLLTTAVAALSAAAAMGRMEFAAALIVVPACMAGMIVRGGWADRCAGSLVGAGFGSVPAVRLFPAESVDPRWLLISFLVIAPLAMSLVWIVRTGIVGLRAVRLQLLRSRR
ncbi:MAG: hypothetical protein WDZ59_07000 [Pirellulales bacterium]